MNNEESIEGEELRNKDVNKSIPDFYINRFNLSVSLYDFEFLFKLASKDDKQGEEKTRIRMSPEHAKALYKILENNIKKYEENFGEVKIPTEIYERDSKDSVEEKKEETKE